MDDLKFNHKSFIDNLKLMIVVTNEFGVPSKKFKEAFIKTFFKVIRIGNFKIDEQVEDILNTVWSEQCYILEVRGCSELAELRGGSKFYKELSKVGENLQTEKDLSDFIEKFDNTLKEKQVYSENKNFKEIRKEKEDMRKEELDKIIKKLIKEEKVKEYDEVYVKGYPLQAGEIRGNGRIFYAGKELKLDNYIINIDSIPSTQNYFQRVIHIDSGKTFEELINEVKQNSKESNIEKGSSILTKLGLDLAELENEVNTNDICTEIETIIKRLRDIKNNINEIKGLEGKSASEKFRALADRVDKKQALEEEVESIKNSIEKMSKLV